MGVNWRVSLVPLKITNLTSGQVPSGATYREDAINYATQKWGTEEEMPILNMSYAGYGQINTI